MKKLLLTVSITIFGGAVSASEGGLFSDYKEEIKYACEQDQNGFVDDAKACLSAKADLIQAQITFAKPDAYIDYGITKIEVGLDHHKWGEFRVSAYTEAVTKARIAMVKEIGQQEILQDSRIKTQKDDSTPEFTAEEKSEYRNLKASTEIGAEVVDAVVEKETGTDVDINEKINVGPMVKSKTTGKSVGSSFKSRVTESISGTFIYKTMEAVDKDGNAYVMAVILNTEKSKKDIAAIYESGAAYQARQDKAEKGVQIRQWFYKNKKSLYTEFGAKLMWDNNGYPIIVSVGQASNDAKPNTMEFELNESDFLPEIAENRAVGQIAELFALQGERVASQDTRKFIGTEKTVSYDGETTTQKEQDIKSLVTTLETLSKSSSHIKGIRGIKRIGTFKNIHPVSGKQIVGVVMAWSPLYDAKAQSYIRTQGADTSKVAGSVGEQETNNNGNTSGTRTTETSVIESQDLMDLSDF